MCVCVCVCVCVCIYIYIYEYDIDDLKSFEEGLKMRYPIEKAVKAKWIRSRNEHANPFLMTLDSIKVLETLHIPGEKPKCINIKYYNKPMLCSNNQDYGHMQKYGKKTVAGARSADAPNRTARMTLSVQNVGARITPAAGYVLNSGFSRK